MSGLALLGLLGLLGLYLAPRVHSEQAEPLFHAVGSAVEMGYCFGVDYMVVFKATPRGDLLLGNSSGDAAAPATAFPAPEGLRGRVDVSQQHHLLGLQIHSLVHSDSGLYRRECWRDQVLVSQHTLELLVCDQEMETTDIGAAEWDGRAELRCAGPPAGLEGTSVRWYHESPPSYRVELFLDTSVATEPLSELPGLVQVQGGGQVLVLNTSVLQPNQELHCVVVKDAECLSFHTMQLADEPESAEVFASEGDTVVLRCPSDGRGQRWATPLGVLNGSGETQGHMRASFGGEPEEFLLVIGAVSEEHGGPYSCHSSSLQVGYSLVLCPRKPPREAAVSLRQVASLDCDVVEGTPPPRVRWHRLDPSGGYELIHDSWDRTVAAPRDLRGRLALSDDGSTLTISNVTAGDLRTYGCVVVDGPPDLNGADYSGDYVGADSGEGDDSERHPWYDSQRCLFKQDSALSLAPDGDTGAVEDPQSDAGAPPPLGASAYAVGAGLVALLVVSAACVLAAVVRRKRKPSGSGPSEDAEAHVDPESARRLTDTDDRHV